MGFEHYYYYYLSLSCAVVIHERFVVRNNDENARSAARERRSGGRGTHGAGVRYLLYAGRDNTVTPVKNYRAPRQPAVAAYHRRRPLAPYQCHDNVDEKKPKKHRSSSGFRRRNVPCSCLCPFRTVTPKYTRDRRHRHTVVGRPDEFGSEHTPERPNGDAHDVRFFVI